jgi:hypothetical protein
VVALVAGGPIECERRRARFHELFLDYSLHEIGSSLARPGSKSDVEDYERLRDAEWKRKKAPFRVYYAAMRQKYQWAEKYPWLPVTPDPPPPK